MYQWFVCIKNYNSHYIFGSFTVIFDFPNFIFIFDNVWYSERNANIIYLKCMTALRVLISAWSQWFICFLLKMENSWKSHWHWNKCTIWMGIQKIREEFIRIDSEFDQFWQIKFPEIHVNTSYSTTDCEFVWICGNFCKFLVWYELHMPSLNGDVMMYFGWIFEKFTPFLQKIELKRRFQTAYSSSEYRRCIQILWQHELVEGMNWIIQKNHRFIHFVIL